MNELRMPTVTQRMSVRGMGALCVLCTLLALISQATWANEDLVSADQLKEIIKQESEKQKHKVFLAPALTRTDARHPDQRYSLKRIRKTRVADWWVWYLDSSDLEPLKQLAAENEQAIASSLSHIPGDRSIIEFTGADMREVVGAYSAICGIDLKMPEVGDGGEDLWAVRQFWNSSVKKDCLEVGFFLAGHSIRVVKTSQGLATRRSTLLPGKRTGSNIE